jgi:hypothetical protein
MRKIEYIFIDSDYPNDNHKSVRPAVSLFRHHFTVNSEGLVTNPIDIGQTVNLIQGPIYDRDKYNKCSISIRYCGTLLPHAWLTAPDASCSAILRQRAALLQLLVELRKHFPYAKILGVSEIDGRELYCKNIIVSDAMNVLRRELSDLP